MSDLMEVFSPDIGSLQAAFFLTAVNKIASGKTGDDIIIITVPSSKTNAV